MANRVITFQQDDILKRLQDNPLEVFLDIDMKSKQYTTYEYRLDVLSSNEISALETDTISVNLPNQLCAIRLEPKYTHDRIIQLYNQAAYEKVKHRIPVYDRYKLLRLVNVNAIRNSLDNIFSWTPGERVLLPEFGSNLRKLLYEGITSYNVEQIVSEIKYVVLKWEPRVQVVSVVDVSTVDDHENNTVHLKVIYNIPGLSDSLFEYEYVHKTNTVI